MADSETTTAAQTADAAPVGGADDAPLTVWWGEYELPPGQTARWRICGLELWIRREADEWWLVWRPESDHEAQPCIAEVELDAAAAPEEEVESARFVFRRTAGRLALRPRVADRPVVVSPRLPVSVLPGEEATLFVSSPIWLEVVVGEELETRLREIAVTRPSDTWFGTLRDGELCYHLLTHARLRLAEMLRLPHRAVTPLAIRNRSSEPLQIDKVKLPVPNLSLFVGDGGLLWTEAVVLVAENAGEMASLDIRRGPPPAAGQAERVSPARERVDRHHLIRAFGSLFR